MRSTKANGQSCWKVCIFCYNLLLGVLYLVVLYPIKNCRNAVLHHFSVWTAAIVLPLILDAQHLNNNVSNDLHCIASKSVLVEAPRASSSQEPSKQQCVPLYKTSSGVILPPKVPWKHKLLSGHYAQHPTTRHHHVLVNKANW